MMVNGFRSMRTTRPMTDGSLANLRCQQAWLITATSPLRPPPMALLSGAKTRPTAAWMPRVEEKSPLVINTSPGSSALFHWMLTPSRFHAPSAEKISAPRLRNSVKFGYENDGLTEIHQATGIVHRQAAQHEAVYQAEDCRRCPDTKGHDHDHRHRESGTAAAGPHGIGCILPDTLEPGCKPDRPRRLRGPGSRRPWRDGWREPNRRH